MSRARAWAASLGAARASMDDAVARRPASCESCYVSGLGSVSLSVSDDGRAVLHVADQAFPIGSDTGTLLAAARWILATFGPSEGEHE